MKKELILAALVLFCSSTQTKASTVGYRQATKTFLVAQKKSFYVRATIGFFAAVYFCKYIYRIGSFLYTKTKKETVFQVMGKKYSSWVNRQRGYKYYITHFFVLIATAILTFYALCGLSASFREIRKKSLEKTKEE